MKTMFQILIVKSNRGITYNGHMGGYSHSVVLSNDETYHYYHFGNGTFHVISKNGKQYDIEDCSRMNSEELFQYSLICPSSNDIKLLKAIQVAIQDVKIPTYNLRKLPSNSVIRVQIECPDYMLSDEEFYEKHFPGKQWRD